MIYRIAQAGEISRYELGFYIWSNDKSTEYIPRDGRTITRQAMLFHPVADKVTFKYIAQDTPNFRSW